MKRLKPLLLVVVAVFVLLASVVITRTALFTSRQVKAEPVPRIAVNTARAAEHLSRAIQFKTISYQDPKQFDREQFLGFHEYLKTAFPGIHRRLERETVADYSLLYTWKGSDPSLKPVVLLAHQDVVPVVPGTEPDWQQPPFSGRIEGGYVWGRGAMDDKGSLLQLFEAVELLIAENYQPRRTIYLALGHNEEVLGSGAVQMAKLLAARGVRAEYVLDEGGSLVRGVVPGVVAPVALIGVAEKGYLSAELTAAAVGGHSSIPPARTAIGALSRALARLEDQQFPARFSGVSEQTFRYLGPEMPLFERTIFANSWLLGPLVTAKLAASKETNATVRTTTAVTIVEGGIKENVLPSKARAVVNFRLLPGDSIESVLEHVRRVIDDPQIAVRPLSTPSAPSAVSSTDAPGFKTIQKTIAQIYPQAVAAPFLVLGGTDSRHYTALSPNLYRFNPALNDSTDLKRIHGTNERTSIESHVEGVRFFVQLLRNSETN